MILFFSLACISLISHSQPPYSTTVYDIWIFRSRENREQICILEIARVMFLAISAPAVREENARLKSILCSKKRREDCVLQGEEEGAEKSRLKKEIYERRVEVR